MTGAKARVKGEREVEKRAGTEEAVAARARC